MTGEQPYATTVFIILPGQVAAPHVRLALARLRAMTANLIVVAAPDDADAVVASLGVAAPDRVVCHHGVQSSRAGYRAGMLALLHEVPLAGRVLLTGGHVFGPVLGDTLSNDLDASGANADSALATDIYAPYWHRPALDPRLSKLTRRDRVPSLDHTVLSEAVMTHPDFRAFWARFQPSGDHWDEFLQCDLGFAEWAEQAGLGVDYAMNEDRLETADPRFYEAHRLMADGCPCLPVAVLTLDPLLHDLNAIELRRALSTLRARDAQMHAAANAFAARSVKPRDFAAMADQYEVLSHQPTDPDKSTWTFGPVAVFIHAFYAEMIGDFWALVRRLPCEAHLYITTASEDDQVRIAAYLTDVGLQPQDFTLRVVAQNRGRDMSSLFITWRDVILARRHQVALRLHSKRTPQVSRRVGESFKAHLFDNLVGSAGYVSNLLTLMEAEPDIGLIAPPVVHVGFGTLGHAWFNNREPLAALMADMEMDVPLDDHTPLAPFGTMYWFRTDALIRMFEWTWRWEDYNAEPHHIDGGLAHVQERLIGYAVRDQGFRIVSAMTPEAAARNYAKLEYKLQRLSAEMPTGNILHQVDDLAALNRGARIQAFRRLRDLYGRLLIWRPGLRDTLRPWRTAAVAVLSPRTDG